MPEPVYPKLFPGGIWLWIIGTLLLGGIVFGVGGLISLVVFGTVVTVIGGIILVILFSYVGVKVVRNDKKV